MKRAQLYSVPNEHRSAFVVCLLLLCFGLVAKIYSFFDVTIQEFAYGYAEEIVSELFVLALNVLSFVLFCVSWKINSGALAIITYFVLLTYEAFPFITGFYQMERKFFYEFTSALHIQGLLCIVGIIVMILYTLRVISPPSPVVITLALISLYVIVLNCIASIGEDTYDYIRFVIEAWSLTVSRACFLVAIVIFVEFATFRDKAPPVFPNAPNAIPVGTNSTMQGNANQGVAAQDTTNKNNLSQ